MKLLKIILFLICWYLLSIIVNAQDLTQVIRGRVIDIESEVPLAFATITITTTSQLLGEITDNDGYFRFEKVPVGRHNLQVSYTGYEPQVIPELMVSSGKELVLTIKMKEQIARLDEVVVKAYTKKDKPLNSMATVSARSFSVEEARRYAGGFDDPGRLVASFAGVTADNTRDNTIIIRGNSPKGLLWRLEGVEISNPNHFADMTTFGGGGISALSALVVGNSDFFTGAFPAEYGNAMSGVFDIKLRSGNNETHEHAFQIGAMGIDISSEGPLGKNTKASYLFNYRYSTMGLIKVVFPPEIKDFLPVYQDLCFKINAPTKNAGTFSLWGLASEDSQVFKAERDSSEWEMLDDRMDGMFTQSVFATGINHKYKLKKNAHLNTSLAFTGNYRGYETDILGFDLNLYEKEFVSVLNYKYTFSSTYNKKFSARHSNRTGVIIDNKHYDTKIDHAPVYTMGMMNITDENDATNLYQMFTQSKIRLGNNLTLNAGLHANYFELNDEFVLEPRAGLRYGFNGSQSISLGYGNHSRLEPLTIYFAKVNDGTNITQPNMDLKVTKAHHIVLAYDKNLNPNMRLKVEPYLQLLYDVPVIENSSFSALNLEADFYFNQELINTGTGKNYGIDVTLERFLKDGYYYLFTASLFDSKYKGDDGIERNTMFNSQHVFNVLYGKEWVIGEDKNKILGVNFRINYFGGKRTTPVDQAASILIKDVVYDETRLFEDKEDSKVHVNAGINYRKNKKKYSSIWSFQMMNVLLSKENYGLYYNYKSKQVERFEFAVPVPNISYKIEF